MQQFLTLLVCSAIAGLCYYHAKKRGKNPWYWFVMGLVFGIFGLLFLLLMPFFKRPQKKAIAAPIPVKPPTVQVLDPALQQKLWYFLDAHNQQYGPMSVMGLNHAWNEGKINPQSYVWNEDFENWKRFEEVMKHSS